MNGSFGSARLRARRLALAVLLLLPMVVPASLTVSAPEKEKDEPLVMENADRFEGYRSRGEYVLSGHVRFSHGVLHIETERAVWLKDKNLVYCESGMKITHRGAFLTADHGSYDKNQGQATAEGNVFMRDSSGEVEATGRSIVYMRYKHLTTMTGEPLLRRFYAAKADSDSTQKSRTPVLPADKAGATKAATAQSAAVGRPANPAKPTMAKSIATKSSGKPNAPLLAAPVAKRDTLTIRGDLMTYDDSLQVAIADGKVRINRDKLRITCKKAEYHDAADSLFLLGEPLVIVDDNQVKGQIMRLGMHGEDIRSLLVKGAAQAHSVEPATDTSQARNSDVNGDSLFLAFKEKNIDSVQVFKNATGTYFDVDKPEFVNRMSGEYMVLRFSGKQITSANVLGGASTTAKSTYYHFEQKKLKGRNDAEGDTIDFAFKEGKVDEVMVKGQAKGTYFGEKQNRPAKDTTSGANHAPAGNGPSVAAPKEALPPAKAASTPAVTPAVHTGTVPTKAVPGPTVPSGAVPNATSPSQPQLHALPPDKPWRKR